MCKVGIEVIVGVLEEECWYLIRCFIIFNMFKCLYIILKWVEFVDGFIDINCIGGKLIIFFNLLISMLVYKKCVEYDVILVG